MPMMMGIFALGATQVFAQSATVVMRNGDRVRADVVDMGAAFTFRINGQEQQVPINDVVLIGSSFVRTIEMLKGLNYGVVSVPTTEIGKIDAGLSCMSLRWRAD